MDLPMKPATAISRQKRKKTSKTKLSTSEINIKNIKLDSIDPKIVTMVKAPKPTLMKPNPNEELSQEYLNKYPILKDQELINRYLKVPLNNNQKGRIRQAVRDSLQGTSKILVPEIIHNKIQSIIKGSAKLTDSELRRIRILSNLLKTALRGENVASQTVKTKTEKEKIDKPKKKTEGDSTQDKDKENDKDGVKKDKDGVKQEKKEQLVKKVKGPKRYVVFLGNLPLDVDKEKIMNHFSEMNEHVKDIRIPKPTDKKKSAIAYLELSNEPSYEFALSKHHSMLGSKRINVLYTAPKTGKVTKANAKSKSAKLIALQKSGKLVGSVPLNKKRSQRRLKMKQAQVKLADQNA